LAHQTLVNYGAYTSFRVEAGGVRGLDQHLARLEASAIELFGAPVGEGRLRDLMRQALSDRADAFLRVSLFSPGITHRQTTAVGAPSVMIGVFDPPPPLAASLRLQLQTYEREAPHLKHVATFGLIRARRAARAAGFDDALFVTRDGHVSEGSLWNIGFLSGERIVWPEAPMLRGVTQAVLEAKAATAGLTSVRRSVRASDLTGFEAAFICNSATPACAVVEIDGLRLPLRLDLIARLEQAWLSTPLQPI
jgi:branched-subunit amino acid aminotransferase/4-amino-4-deoxychorismate lyase